MQDIAKTVREFDARRLSIRDLPPKEANKLLLTHLQTQHAALGACAELLKELSPLLQPVDASSPIPQDLEDAFGVELLSTLVALIEDAEDLAGGRDTAVLRKVGWRLLGTSAKWLGKLSPIRPDDVRDVMEAAELVLDIASLKAALKERKKQAAAAAALLNWSKSRTLLAMSWAIEAERIRCLLTKQPEKTEDELVAAVQQRMVALVVTW